MWRRMACFAHRLGTRRLLHTGTISTILLGTTIHLRVGTRRGNLSTARKHGRQNGGQQRLHIAV